MEKVINGVVKTWEKGLFIIAILGVAYAIVQLVLGNYQSTASFEF